MGKRTFIARVADTVFTLVNCGCISYCVSAYVFNPLICYGPSMEPTLHSYDVVISEHISSRLRRFNYGDIVVFKSLNRRDDFICKRIVGLPGDRIYFRDKRIVPAGHVWLEGDNRDDSLDSRDFGPVPQGLIVGRVICKIFPFKDVTMLTVKSP